MSSATATATAKKSKKTADNVSKTDELLAAKYQKKTDKEHVLSNPDTYIGSVELIESKQWVYDNASNQIVERLIQYIPGLYKLFDEGIVNCRDHAIRMNQIINGDNGINAAVNAIPVTNIEVAIDETDGTISFTNDGNGIDVEKHPEYNLWIPEMIFGHLRTSTNYNTEEKKIVGGKNGYGVKLLFIWSTFGSIETVDHIRGLKYTQTFRDNLNIIDEPKITKCGKAKPYTKITFRPDYDRFKYTLTPDFVALLKKRVYDIAAVTEKQVKVKYNNELVPVRTFANYIDLYISDNKEEAPRVQEDPDPRWSIAAALSPTGEFMQVSFVNGIHTAKGGKHVEYILGQITRKLYDYIEKKKKVQVSPTTIKEQLILFVRCDIENPAFDSQTKDYMNTPSNKFGSSCTVSDKFIEKLAKMGIMDAACALTEAKESKAAKRTDGVKTRHLRGIPKLEDANWAGTEKSNQCTIIFAEGDSAKAGVISGLSKDDRNVIGVFPLRGKLMNIRGETTKRIADNAEISNIKKIIGLESGKTYTEEDINTRLRYGRVMFLMDQDIDGSHIKGLLINMFDTEWPSLVKIPGFLTFMNTPILKAKKGGGSEELCFYNDGEYEEWKRNQTAQQLNAWKIKYFKGLGTSTDKEFKQYFAAKKQVNFVHTGDECKDAIDRTFNKKRADDRKEWLETFDRSLYLNTTNNHLSYKQFIDQDLIHFSVNDCMRSIPNLVDGLKTSLRKILYAAFKKNLKTEIKVAQFSGYVSEHTCYHHGEQSLNGAIVGMAQDFVGSNNIHLLEPLGQFGTRSMGGKDSASERYIFTALNKLTRYLFPQADDNVLRYLEDDGYPVEPIYYVPILPMVLINSSKGIGTGFSTEILGYHPMDLVGWLKAKLGGAHNNVFHGLPYWEGFTGSVHLLTTAGSTVSVIEEFDLSEVDQLSLATATAATAVKKYLVKGKYQKVDADKIVVTELPVGYWTEDFKEHLDHLMDLTDKNGKRLPSPVREYVNLSANNQIEFVISFAKGTLDTLEQEIVTRYGSASPESGSGSGSDETVNVTINGLEKMLKLYTTFSTSNMHLFDAKEKLRKYSNVTDILNEFFEVRIDLYNKRKTYLMERLEKEMLVLANKSRFIGDILSEKIDLRGKKKDYVVALLRDGGYYCPFDDLEFKYLVKMPMDSVTVENKEQLFNELATKEAELMQLKNTTVEKMWMNELDEFTKYYSAWLTEKREQQQEQQQQQKDNGATANKKKRNLISGSSNSNVISKKHK